MGRTNDSEIRQVQFSQDTQRFVLDWMTDEDWQALQRAYQEKHATFIFRDRHALEAAAKIYGEMTVLEFLRAPMPKPKLK